MAPAAARRRGGGGAAVLRQGFAKLYGGGGGVGEGEGGTKGMGAAALPSPSIYRVPRGAPALEIQSPKGAAAKGGGVPPKPSGAPPTPRVFNPRRRGRPKGGAPAH